MEERESPISGSPENTTDSGSPTPISAAAAATLGSGAGGVVLPPPPSGDGAAFSGSGGGTGGSLTGSKKRRGRPRKYDENGNLNPAYARAAAAKAAAPTVSPPPGFTLTMPENYVAAPKRGRGRGVSSAGNWQPVVPPQLGEVFANTAGGDFTPYIITVQTGEDVTAKIHSFSQKGPRGICILSANGAISNVTIRQPGSSGGLLTYEGRFEILSLSGSYTVSEAGGVTTRNGGLSISLAGPDGRVVGGSVAGWLTAASPIQVVIGSFVPMGYKAPKRKYHRESPNVAGIPAIPETMTALNPASQAMPEAEAGPPHMTHMPAQSHSEEEDDSPVSGHNLNAVSSHHTPEWANGLEQSSDHRIYPDINVSVPGV